MDSYLERLRQELEDAIGGASPGALAEAPAGKWSAAQILEHLFLTYKNTNRGIAKCLERGAPLATGAGRESRVSPCRAQSPGTCHPARNGAGRGAASHRARAREDELRPGRLRAQVRRPDENHGPPVPWTFDGRRVAQVSLGPWAASRAPDSGADGKILKSHVVEGRASRPSSSPAAGRGRPALHRHAVAAPVLD